MNRWTEAQTDAISRRGSDILISAGAGSGKTAVLVERIISLIKDDRTDADRLLIVTFTKAAAAEIKLRIRKALFLQLHTGQDSAFLHEQIGRLDNAQISTFHAYCLKIVQSFYYIIGLDPGCSLLTDAELDIIKNECLDSLFEQYYSQNNEGFLRTADRFSSGSDDRKLREIILSIYSASMNMLSPGEWLKKADESCSLSIYDPGNNPAAAYLAESARSRLLQASAIVDEAYEICTSLQPEPKRAAYFAEAQSMLGILLRSCGEDFSAFLAVLEESKFARYDIRTPSESSDLLKFMQKTAKEILSELKSGYAFSSETYERQLTELSGQTRMLTDIAADFSELFRARKAELNCIDYNDLEHYTLRILEDPEAAQEIRSSYDYAMIDEYQDTNEIQETIITKTAKPDCLFCVGDIKQSIYRFRDADPEIFARRYEEYTKDPGRGKLIFLNTNFRTNSKIIGAVNDIFGRIFFRQTGGTDYYPNEKLNAASECSENIKAEARILDLNDTALDEDNEDKSTADHEGALIASLIEELISSGIEVTDASSQTKRKLRYSDIAVLSRSLSGTHESYSAALRKRNIPFSSDYADSFYDEIEVSFVMSILRLIDNEYDDIALLSAMRSYLYDFNADELLKIKLSAPDRQYFYECAENYSQSGDDESVKTKLSRLYSDIRHFRNISMHVSAEELIRTIYSATNIQVFAAALPNSGIRRENLEYLLTLASSYEKTAFKGLYHFLKYAEKRRENSVESRRKLSSASGGDAVKVMTIHKSKGLEFEIVIIAGSTKRFNTADIRSNVLSDKEFGVCSQLIDTDNMSITETLMYKAAKEKLTDGNTAEEMRLMYVAMTRAKNRLFFTGTARNRKDIELERRPLAPVQHEIMSASSYYSWLKTAVCCSDFTCGGDILAENESWIIRLADPGQLKTAAAELPVTAETGTAADSAGILFEKVRENISFEYPNKISSSIPSKLSVTSLSGAETLAAGEKVLEFTKAPKFMDPLRELTAAEKGSTAHRILQKIDFASFRNRDTGTELLRQTEMLLEHGVLDREETDAVDSGLIVSFLDSELGQTMISAQELHRESAFIMTAQAGEISEEWKGTGEEVIIQGIIDCWFFYEDRLYLVDYKTDRIIYSEPEDTSLSKHIRQLRLYSQALEKLHGRKPDCCYIAFLNMKNNFRAHI